MYASLDRADLAVDDEGGGRIAVQTDHRSAGEIDEDYDLSVVFGLTRALNPLRSDRFQGVRFAFMQGVHPEYVGVLERAGAEIEALTGGERSLSRGEPDDEATDAELQRALTAIGKRVLASHRLEPNEAGLTELQRLYYAQATASEGRDEDAITWWTSVVELGAVIGEVIAAGHGGRWVRDREQLSTIPFVFGHENSVMVVFDKVERFFERGASEAPTALLRILEDEGEEGEVMFNLRPAGWGARSFAHCRPLIEQDHPEMPLVALVLDLPNTTRSVPSDVEDPEALEARARVNIAGIQVTIDELDLQGHAVLASHGDYYASEKLLDPDHMAELHRKHGADLLLAAVPRKGVLFTLSAMMSAEASALMMALAHGQHDDAPPNERLSPLVFLVQEGQVVGLVRFDEPEEDAIPEAAVDESDPNPPKKGFWARLFGG